MRRTVLVVDDHPGFRGCARYVLEAQGYRVVGEAASAADAVVRARDLRPDLALVDVHLPDADGFELAGRLVALDGGPAVVLTSSHDRSEIAPYVADSGACGFVPKDELCAEEIEALLLARFG